jgi:hypothetical protein
MVFEESVADAATVIEPVLCPAGTEIAAGCALRLAVSLYCTAMVWPPPPAGPSSVAVRVVEPPAPRFDGDANNETRLAAWDVGAEA